MNFSSSIIFLSGTVFTTEFLLTGNYFKLYQTILSVTLKNNF